MKTWNTRASLIQDWAAVPNCLAPWIAPNVHWTRSGAQGSMTTWSNCPMAGLLATLPWLRPKGPLVGSSKDCSGYPVLSYHLQNNHIITIIISVKHSRQPILKIILTCSLNKHFIECLSHAKHCAKFHIISDVLEAQSWQMWHLSTDSSMTAWANPPASPTNSFYPLLRGSLSHSLHCVCV